MSNPYLVHEVFASVLQIAGTFLLAVEAIKLENLRRLREGVFAKSIRALTPRLFVPVSATAEEVDALRNRKMSRVMLLLGVVGFAFLLFLISMTSLSLTEAWASFRLQFPPASWGGGLAGSMLFLLVFFWSVMLGFFLYKLVLLPFHVPLRLLELIEKKTASGGIGITGFVLFLVGALVSLWLKFVTDTAC